MAEPWRRLRVPGRIAVPVLVFGALAAGEPSSPPAGWVGIREYEGRWLRGGEVSSLVPFKRAEIAIGVDSIRRDDGRDYALRVNRVLGQGNASRAELRIDPHGELVSAWVAPDDMADWVIGPGAHETADAARALIVERQGGPLFQDAWVWDIAPLAVPPLRPGATGTGPIRYRAERFGFLQSLSGSRVTTMLRDTVVDGHRLWVGRDSARVEVRERIIEPKRALEAVQVVERVATGTLRGRFLYDPETGLFRTRRDTLVAEGEATLRLPDGRVYRTPAKLERRSAWALRSAEEHEEWKEEEERRRRRDSYSIVYLPKTPLQHRIAGGDTAAVDSLLEAWASADANERAGIAESLRFAGSEARARLDSLRIDAYPAWVRRMASGRVRGGPPLDSASMAEYLRFLRDPGLAFSYRLDTDPLYENLSGGLVMFPPSLDAPPQRTSCTPAACRLVAAETDAAEPRLRQVAAVARFILDPERWADSLLAREDTAAHLIHPAVLLARGVGATGETTENWPIPGPGADWLEWSRWTGVDSVSGPVPPIRWADTHRYAVRMTERLTGRDIGAELMAALDTATNETGRAALRELAMHVGAIRPSIDEIVAGMRSPDPLDQAQARTALRQRWDERQPADSALQHELAAQLLAQAVDGDSVWIAGPEGELPRPVTAIAERLGSPLLYLADDHVPAPLRRAWDARPDVAVISRQEYRGQPSRSPGLLLEIDQVTTLGPLAWIELTLVAREPRGPDEGPDGWATGTMFMLLRTEEGWVVLRNVGWVT